MEDVRSAAWALRDAFGASKILLAGGDLEAISGWLAAAGSATPILVASPHPGATDRFRRPTSDGDDQADANQDVEVLRLGFRMGNGIDSLRLLRDIVLTAYVEGYIAADERLMVAALGDEGDVGLHCFDMSHDESVARLKKDLEYRADVGVVEAVLHLARDLAREGREHSPVGALWAIGDTDRVLKHSRQVVLNPFEGHPPQDRSALDPRNWETIKEFAQIDGAMIVRDDGVLEAAGRYIEVRDPTDLQSGLGGRHLAAAAITNETKAIAITLSETGVIRIFKDGRSLLRIGVT